ncbi:MAG: EAL domain-containing protein, partial [Planctomycetes bacterium]|nr:EAL domain-containing protein [Planctomycetota bacterium]
VRLACLIAFMEPYPMDSGAGGALPPGTALPFYWLGIHGLFLSIAVAFGSTILFFRLLRVGWLTISFYSEESDAAITHAFLALIPGMITIILFAMGKHLATTMGIDSLHRHLMTWLSLPFERLDNTLSTAMLYTFLRHLFWFFGIHGTNLLEPMTASLYGTAMAANQSAAAAGTPVPYIFTKTFFDAFISLGGSGSTLCLILAVLVANRRGSMRKISQISILPALFNINELIIFGLPIVLNPMFLVPFLLVPLLQCLVAYLAVVSGLVPATVHPIDWTAPIFIGGFAATGSLAGSVLQGVNLLLGAAIYLPFVRLAEAVKRDSFNRAFRELLSGGECEHDSHLTPEARVLARSLVGDLAQAAARGELSLEYQPQVESLTGKVFGVEALLRWDHTYLGRIPPALFIGLAEESGLIQDLGAWALEECCRQQSLWREQGVTDVTMSVNLSVYELDGQDIVGEIAERVNRYAIPPGMLEVEVTESAALGGGGHRSAILGQIHDLGVALAIDDFGMGHSSLVYLKHFPVDTIKIDRILSRDVATSRHSSEIILTVAELCRSLDIQILIEYVDNIEQLKALQALGCTRIQGWLYSPSLTADKCLEFIRTGAPVY